MPRGRPPSSKTLVDRQLGRNLPHPVLPAGDDFIIPNYSGVGNELKEGLATDLGTEGSVLFLNSTGNIAEDNSNLFWDDTNNRLGVNMNTPTVDFEVAGVIRASTSVNSDVFAQHGSASNANIAMSVDDTMTFDTGGLQAMHIDASQNVIVGNTITADGLLNVFSGSAGDVSARVAGDDFVIENSTNGGMSILTPDTSTSTIIFGSPTDPLGADLKWNHDNNVFIVGSRKTDATLRFVSGGGVTALNIDGNQNFDFQAGDLTTTGAILGGGLGHDQFSDFVANEHIDWTADQGATNIHSENLNLIEGEGIDISGTTISGEDATTTNKGIAKFNNDFFTLTAGDVKLTGTIVKFIQGDTGSEGGVLNIFKIFGGEGIDTSAATGTLTISGEDATDTNKGIAKFDPEFYTVASGEVAPATASRARATRETDQTMIDNSFTKIAFATEKYDGLGEFDVTTNVGRFTATNAGFYSVSSQIVTRVVAWTINDVGIISIFKNGSRFIDLARTTIGSTITDSMGVSGSSDIQLAANDYIEIHAIIIRGANTNLLGSSLTNSFSIHRLS